MKKGEKAVLTCAPEYAYGESGSSPNIGPNATLIFEVEFIKSKPPLVISLILPLMNETVFRLNY